MKDNHKINKSRILALFTSLNKFSEEQELDNILPNYISTDIILNITNPYEEMKGLDSFLNRFIRPLKSSFSNLMIQPYILIGGAYEGRDYVSATGNMIGTFINDWLGIPSNNQATYLRFASHFFDGRRKS